MAFPVLKLWKSRANRDELVTAVITGTSRLYRHRLSRLLRLAVRTPSPLWYKYVLSTREKTMPISLPNHGRNQIKMQELSSTSVALKGLTKVSEQEKGLHTCPRHQWRNTAQRKHGWGAPKGLLLRYCSWYEQYSSFLEFCRQELYLYKQVSSMLPVPGNLHIMNLLWDMRRAFRQNYFKNTRLSQDPKAQTHSF